MFYFNSMKSENMFLIIIFLSILALTTGNTATFRKQKDNHKQRDLTEKQTIALANLSNLDHMNEILDNICIERPVGSPGHEQVKEFIYDTMKDFGWAVELDEFYDEVPPPYSTTLKFSNVIARLNPNATRYLTLACHYDSKYMPNIEFVGAIDSAVPCSQLINTAKVMHNYLEPLKSQDVSLMFIFFDGEEAFVEWTANDSIYGARHLAKKWKKNPSLKHIGKGLSELDKIDLLVLLDLIGAPDPQFYNFFKRTERWYKVLVEAESKLAKLGLLDNYFTSLSQHRYFQPSSINAYIEDDHIPFLRRDVPILHIIPRSFPRCWHTAEDKREKVDLKTTENISKIIRIFIATYLEIEI